MLLLKVEVWPHLVPIWNAFWRLGRDRQIGPSGHGPIPTMAIDRWAARHGFEDGPDYERFETLITAMDDVILDHWAEARKQRDAEAERKSRRR